MSTHFENAHQSMSAQKDSKKDPGDEKKYRKIINNHKWQESQWKIAHYEAKHE